MSLFLPFFDYLKNVLSLTGETDKEMSPVLWTPFWPFPQYSHIDWAGGTVFDPSFWLAILSFYPQAMLHPFLFGQSLPSLTLLHFLHLFILLILLPNSLIARTRCVRAKGRVVCSTDPDSHFNVEVKLVGQLNSIKCLLIKILLTLG